MNEHKMFGGIPSGLGSDAGREIQGVIKDGGGLGVKSLGCRAWC